MTNLATSYKPAAAVSNAFVISDGYVLTSVILQVGPTYRGYGSIGLIGGSISPTTIEGFTIAEMYSGEGLDLTGFTVTGNALQTLFTSISTSAGTLNTVDAIYSFDGTYTSWVWLGTMLVTTTGDIPVSFVIP